MFSELIEDGARVAEVAAEIAAHGSVAFDIEFVSEGRMIPELSLVQLAWGEPGSPRVVVIDYLAVGEVGLAPVLALIGRPDIEIVAHAARQDLGILAMRFGVRAAGLVDTQLAGAFAGLGDQISYARLVERVLGVTLDKAHQFTAWLEQPLEPDRLRYAADDVRHLPLLWSRLREELDRRGRLPWLHEESERLARAVAPLCAPEDVYRQVKGYRALAGVELAALRGLAAWRQRQAVAENKPLSWILPDPAMIELCRRAATLRNIRVVRGVGDGTARRYGADILAVIAASATEPPPVITPVESRPLSQRAQLWAGVLLSLVQACCIREDIAPRLVITRAEAELLADWYDRGAVAPEPAIMMLTGWRRELAGEVALAWLRGDLALLASPSAAGIISRPAS